MQKTLSVNWSVLVTEDLGVSNMVKNKHLSKSISDASWATEWAGNIAAEVHRKSYPYRCAILRFLSCHVSQ